jgi:hypothetical protein
MSKNKASLPLEAFNKKLTSIDINYSKTFHLPEPERTEEQKKIIKEIFDSIPSLSSKTTIDEFHHEFGKHSSKLTRGALLYAIEEFMPSNGSENVDLSELENLIDEVEVPIYTGKNKKQPVYDSDNEASVDYVEVPEYETKKLFVISDKEKFQNIIQSAISTALATQNEAFNAKLVEATQTNNSNTTSNNNIQYEVAKVLNEVLSNKKVEISSNDGTKNIVLNLPNAIRNNNIKEHYDNLGEQLLESIIRQNGIYKVNKQYEAVKQHKLEDGTFTNQKVLENREVLQPGEGATPFAHTLFFNDIRDQNNNPILLYNIWTQRLAKTLHEKFVEWVGIQGARISPDNDRKFINLFANALGTVNEELSVLYPAPNKDGWQPILPNIFVEPAQSNADKMYNYVQEQYNPKPQIQSNIPVVNSTPSPILTSNFNSSAPAVAPDSQSLEDIDPSLSDDMNFLASLTAATSIN